MVTVVDAQNFLREYEEAASLEERGLIQDEDEEGQDQRLVADPQVEFVCVDHQPDRSFSHQAQRLMAILCLNEVAECVEVQGLFR